MGINCPVCILQFCAEDGEVPLSSIQETLDLVQLMCDLCGFDCNFILPQVGECISSSFINSIRSKVEEVYIAVLSAGIACPVAPDWTAGCWVDCSGKRVDLDCVPEDDPAVGVIPFCTGGGFGGRLEDSNPCTGPNDEPGFVAVCICHVEELGCWARVIADCCFALCCACFDCCYGSGDTGTVEVDTHEIIVQFDWQCPFPNTEPCIMTIFGASYTGSYSFFGCLGGLAVFTPDFTLDPVCEQRPVNINRNCATGAWLYSLYAVCSDDCIVPSQSVTDGCLCFALCQLTYTGGGPPGDGDGCDNIIVYDHECNLGTVNCSKQFTDIAENGECFCREEEYPKKTLTWTVVTGACPGPVEECIPADCGC